MVSVLAQIDHIMMYNEIAKLLIDAYSNFYPILYFASMRKIVRAKRLTSLNLIWTFFESQKEKKFFLFSISSLLRPL